MRRGSCTHRLWIVALRLLGDSKKKKNKDCEIDVFDGSSQRQMWRELFGGDDRRSESEATSSFLCRLDGLTVADRVGRCGIQEKVWVQQLMWLLHTSFPQSCLTPSAPSLKRTGEELKNLVKSEQFLANLNYFKALITLQSIKDL